MPEAEGCAAVESIVVIPLLQLASAGKAMPLAQTLLGSGCAFSDFGSLAILGAMAALMGVKLSRNCLGSSKTLLSVQ
jgi:hypothetical protein